MKKNFLFLLAVVALLTACSKHVSNQELYPFSENGKWGYINQNGEVVIKPQFEAAEDFVGDYATVLLDTPMLKSLFGYTNNRPLWDVIDRQGKLQHVVSGVNLSCSPHEITKDGYAISSYDIAIRGSNTALMYDIFNIKDGKHPFPLRSYSADLVYFESMEHLQQTGILVFHDIDEGWGFMDLDGNVIIEPQYPGFYGVQNGIISVQDTAGKFYLIDKTGARTTKQEYESIVFHLGHNLFTTSTDDGFTYINSKGDIMSEQKFEDIVDDFDDNGLIFVKVLENGNLRYALADTTGKIVIGPYDELWVESEGLRSYGVGEYPEYKEGYIDNKGNIVIEPRFYQVGAFHEGLAWAKEAENDKFGYIGKTGEFVIQPKFEDANNFEKCGLAIVKNGDLYGVIDKTGKYILDPVYEEIITIYDTGMIRFKKDGKYGYANAQGKIVK